MSLREKKSVFSNGVSQGHQSYTRAGHKSNSVFIIGGGLFVFIVVIVCLVFVSLLCFDFFVLLLFCLL